MIGVTQVILLCAVFGQTPERLSYEKASTSSRTITPSDCDGDGLDDVFELKMAEAYAPIVGFPEDDENYPTNVDWLLRRTALYFYDRTCNNNTLVLPEQPGATGLTQRDLHWRIKASCFDDYFDSYGWADHGNLDPWNIFGLGALLNRSKERTFYLMDLAEADRKGSLDSTDWRTYVHVYPNSQAGITIQYWRCYAYNTGHFLGTDAGKHGGDWEGIHVVISAAGVPSVRLLGHADISDSAVEWLGSHPKVYSEPGKHATLSQPDNNSPHVSWESWSGGNVTWPDGRRTKSGGLINVGEKQACLNNQYFIYYSGLWGSIGMLKTSTGYWGPAFNETGMPKNGMSAAWCDGMATITEEGCFPCQIRHSERGNVETWIIDKPNVRQSQTTYSTILFSPGDEIQIEAGGCAQTGGHGDTWKRYVNPPDDMYYGLISIPGITSGLQPIRDYLGRTLVVPNRPVCGITLGYVDDDYRDNGYWGHDDGTDNQCAGVGDAFVAITATHDKPVRLDGPSVPIAALAASPDGNHLVSAGEHSQLFGEVRIWKLDDFRIEATFGREAAGVTCLAYSRDGSLLATGQSDGTIKVWQMPARTPLASLSGGSRPISAVCFIGNESNRLLSASLTGAIELWSGDHFRDRAPVAALPGPVFSLACSSDGTRLAAGGRGNTTSSGKLWLWSIPPAGMNQKLHFLRALDVNHPARCVSFSADDSRLVVATGDAPDVKPTGTPSEKAYEVQTWNTASGDKLSKMLGHVGSINAACFCGPMNEYISSCGADGQLKIWSAASGEELASVSVGKHPLTSLKWLPARGALAVGESQQSSDGDGRGAIWIWDLERVLKRFY